MNEDLNKKAESDSNLEQFMRQSLAGHRVEPSPGIWKGISRKLLWHELSHFNFSNITRKLWMLGGTGLLVITAGLYFLSSGSGKTSEPKTLKPTVISTSLLSPNAGIHEKHTAVLVTSSHVEKQISSLSGNRHKQQKTNEMEKDPATSDPSLPIKGSAPDDLKSNTDHSGQQEGGTLLSVPAENQPVSNLYKENTDLSGSASSIAGILRLPSRGPGLLNIALNPDTTVIIQTQDHLFKIHFPGGPSGAFFSASLGIQPEITFNPGVSSDSKLNFWINSRASVHFSRFSISTGINAGYLTDECKYQIEYISRDSVGFYTSVVSYEVGAGNKIIYNTTTENIYDSVQHIADDRTRARYTYLQVPLLAGYRLFQSDLLSLTIHAGPMVSFLVNSREPEPEINYRSFKVIKVENQTPQRNAINWQVWVDLNLEFRMNKSLSLFVEPSCRYFLSAPTKSENNSSEKSWSTGLGLGLQYKFGQNFKKK